MSQRRADLLWLRDLMQSLLVSEGYLVAVRDPAAAESAARRMLLDLDRRRSSLRLLNGQAPSVN